MKDFRPINFVGGMYKIISKVLANRLHRVAYGLILDFQNAFIKCRHILDFVLIASKCINSRLKSGSVGGVMQVGCEESL